MLPDPLDSMLRNFCVSANLIHSGPLCGVNTTPMSEGLGHVHIIQRGWADVRHEKLPALYVSEPTLLFYPRPLAHRFLTEEIAGANFLCTTVAFTAGRSNPIVQALPPLLVVLLADMPEISATLDLLMTEASSDGYGRRTTIDRLFEVLVTLLLRKILADGTMSQGLLAGLGHPQLGKALVALHEAPERAWTLGTLADVAGMSRSRFAQTFKATLGETVGEYVVGWRMGLAQQLLRSATPLKHVASKVGYGSPLALTRVFRTHVGISPRAWLKNEGVIASQTPGSHVLHA